MFTFLLNIFCRLSFFLIFVLVFFNSNSQTEPILTPKNKSVDSLRLILQNAKHDTSRINALYEWAKFISSNQPDEAISLFEKAQLVAQKNIEVNPIKINDEAILTLDKTQNLNSPSGLKLTYLRKSGKMFTCIGYMHSIKGEGKLAIRYYNKSKAIFIKIHDQIGVATMLNNIAAVYFETGKVKEALDYYQKSLKLRENIGDDIGIAGTLNNMAIVYDSQGQIKEALNYYNQCLKTAEKMGDKELIASSLNNIGCLFQDQGQLKEAMNNFLQSLKIREKINDKKGIAESLNNMATIYKDQGQLNEALKYYQRSLKIKQNAGNKNGISISLYNIALIYEQQGQIKEALDYLLQSLKISESIDDKLSATDALNNIAKIYFDQGQMKPALEYGTKSLRLSKELGFPIRIRESAQTLKEIYEKQGNTAKTLEMFSLYITMRDSIINVDNLKASYKSKIQHEYDKKVLADSIRTASEKKITLAKLAESQAKLKQEKTLKFALYSGLFLLLIFSGFIYNRFKNSQKQKQLIEKQKLVVDESQRKIIASINYAKKIQTSMLPSQEEMINSFEEIFVFYKPKDIVSGDFYWFHSENGFSYLAVADCTGHGVPGAFMTMIAQSILNEVVVKQKITEPDEILNHLHSLIFKALKQDKGDEYSQDGMDVSFVKIDHKQKLLTFAGARNNGFVVYNKQIEILKATSKSIGGLSLLGEVEPDRKFKSETFQIKENSMLVLSTDGIFDQLNVDDKKFGVNRFKETILKFDTNAISTNADFLEVTVNNWKKSVIQLDDILLVGLKI